MRPCRRDHSITWPHKLAGDAAPAQIGRDPHSDEVGRRRVVADERRHHSVERSVALVGERDGTLGRPRALTPADTRKRARVLDRLEERVWIALERAQADIAQARTIIGLDAADHASSFAHANAFATAAMAARRLSSSAKSKNPPPEDALREFHPHTSSRAFAQGQWLWQGDAREEDRGRRECEWER